MSATMFVRTPLEQYAISYKRIKTYWAILLILNYTDYILMMLVKTTAKNIGVKEHPEPQQRTFLGPQQD